MTSLPTQNNNQTNEQRYRQLFEHVPICIFVVDLSAIPTAILEANQRAQVTYGYSAAELVGMPAVTLVPEQARGAMQKMLVRVRQGQTITTETTNQRRDSTRFPVRVTAAPDPSDPARMIVTVEDITTEVQRRSEADAIDAERRRIAHEIHDGVAQNLAGLRFESALWQHLAADAPPRMRAALAELQTVLANAMLDIRRAIFSLRPVDLEALGLFPALAQLVRDFGDHNQLPAIFEFTGSPENMPPGHELPIFRIIQESLNNISQHAQASSVMVRLDLCDDGQVDLLVQDDGRGFDPSQIGPRQHADHFGLRQMRERIQELGGTLDIHSAPGHGTQLIICLPSPAYATD